MPNLLTGYGAKNDPYHKRSAEVPDLTTNAVLTWLCIFLIIVIEVIN